MLWVQSKVSRVAWKKKKSNQTMCHALEIRFETTHQTSLTSAGCRSQTSLHINLFVFFPFFLSKSRLRGSLRWGGRELLLMAIRYFSPLQLILTVLLPSAPICSEASHMVAYCRRKEKKKAMGYGLPRCSTPQRFRCRHAADAFRWYREKSQSYRRAHEKRNDWRFSCLLLSPSEK